MRRRMSRMHAEKGNDEQLRNLFYSYKKQKKNLCGSTQCEPSFSP